VGLPSGAVWANDVWDVEEGGWLKPRQTVSASKLTNNLKVVFAGGHGEVHKKGGTEGKQIARSDGVEVPWAIAQNNKGMGVGENREGGGDKGT